MPGLTTALNGRGKLEQLGGYAVVADFSPGPEPSHLYLVNQNKVIVDSQGNVHIAKQEGRR